MRRLAAGACALALALGLAGCGEREETLSPGETARFDLLLDYFPNADHAPIYAARSAGHFRTVGLDVRIRAPSSPSAPINQVAAGRADLAISYAPEVMRARDRGLAVVAVGALVQRPLTSIIALPESGIRRPSDLEGKRVGTAGIDYQGAYLRTILAEAGLQPDDVRQRDVGFDLVPALLTRRVDAVLGGFWNYEGVELEQRRRRPTVIRVDDAGVPRYDELVLVANADALERDGAGIRAFVAGLARGQRDLDRDPDRALRALLSDNRDLEPRLQREVVRRTAPLFRPPRGRPYGYQDPDEWRRFGEWMQDNRLIRPTTDPAQAFTNDFLPGRGLRR